MCSLRMRRGRAVLARPAGVLKEVFERHYKLRSVRKDEEGDTWLAPVLFPRLEWHCHGSTKEVQWEASFLGYALVVLAREYVCARRNDCAKKTRVVVVAFILEMLEHFVWFAFTNWRDAVRAACTAEEQSDSVPCPVSLVMSQVILFAGVRKAAGCGAEVAIVLAPRWRGLSEAWEGDMSMRHLLCIALTRACKRTWLLFKDLRGGVVGCPNARVDRSWRGRGVKRQASPNVEQEREAGVHQWHRQQVWARLRAIAE